MAPPVPSSTPPTTELAEMAASNAAVAGATSNAAIVTSATSNVAVAVSATSIATVVGGVGFFVGALVLVAVALSPGQDIIPKVQCPGTGAAMFAGFKVSNTSEDRQLFMVTLADLPERLELFLTNSFSLSTMSEEFAGNKTGSVKVRRYFILIQIEREMQNSSFSEGDQTKLVITFFVSLICLSFFFFR
jgi:hypothetical protein